MNNLIYKDMAKTVFKGVINGETFDNVNAYNARMKELLDAGVQDISAASSTEVKMDHDTNVYTTTTSLDTLDEDLSLYPFMCEDDPFYLDFLVTDNAVVNQEAYNEAQKVLEKCYRYIREVMEDCCNCERKEYLNDVNEIIGDINADIADTARAMDVVDAKKKAEEEYQEEMKKLNKELEILKASDKVAGMLKAYYEDVQNEMLTMIKEDQDNKCCNKNCEHNVKEPEVTTSVEEKMPQTVADFNSLINRIFGDYGIYKK